MENAEAQSTLREDLLASFDSVVESPDTPAESVPPAADETPAQETAEQKAGRTANRMRDEQGRLLPGKKETEPAATPQPVVARPARPQSWKKDYDAQWETLDPKLAEYIHQREREYQSGVSTYKSEAESARTLNEAIAPFLPNLQRHGIEPTQWIRNLGAAHERLALGSPQDKVAFTAQLLNQYQIDPQALFQYLTNPQAQQNYQQQYRPPAQAQPDFEKIIEQKLTEKEIKAEFNRFVAEAQEKYPHYEAVKDTMAGFLQAGLAQDYKSAYEAALRHPRHEALLEADRQQRQEQEAAAVTAQKQGVVNRARSQAVSVKSSTPAGTITATQEDKSRRDELAATWDSKMASRV